MPCSRKWTSMKKRKKINPRDGEEQLVLPSGARGEHEIRHNAITSPRTNMRA